MLLLVIHAYLIDGLTKRILFALTKEFKTYKKNGEINLTEDLEEEQNDTTGGNTENREPQS